MIKNLIKASQTPHTFTIIYADDAHILLYEGKTIMAAEPSDFHSGKEDAYFLKKKIKKSWSNPEHLHLLCEKVIKDSTKLMIYHTEEDIHDFLVEEDLYTTADEFCA